MALENKLGLTSSADLAREEERILFCILHMRERIINRS